MSAGAYGLQQAAAVHTKQPLIINMHEAVEVALWCVVLHYT